MQSELGISERWACRTISQPRSTQRKLPRVRGDETALTADIVALATKYGRYGTDTLSLPARRMPSYSEDSGGNSRRFPSSISLSAKGSERGAGDQVRLEIEGVVDGGMGGEETLG